MISFRKLKPVRVAAVQLAAGTDVARNLETVLAMLDRASEGHPDLIVLPEFVNHASWYDGPSHCYEVSVPLDGAFLEAVARKAREHRAFVVVNTTTRRAAKQCTGTSVLFDRNGQRLAEANKQILMGHENDVLVPAEQRSPVVDTEIGRLGLYSCMDGVVFEPARCHALLGAQILTNSLNSFAFDEASLHIPVRAAENRVFVVAANKVGPLVPDAALVSRMTGIPAHFLEGAGESQIVAPDGTVLARAPTRGATCVFADIDPAEANDKRRPDGTDVFAARRPELYGPLGEGSPPRSAAGAEHPAEAIGVAVLATPDGAGALDFAARRITEAAQAGVRLVVLPELFGLPHARVEDGAEEAQRAEATLETLQALARGRGIHIATSLVRRHGGALAHAGVLLGPEGLITSDPQLHRIERHARWVSRLGDRVAVATLPFGRVAVIVGEDALFPEVPRLAALGGADILAIPFHATERWETDLGLLERSAENRVIVVAATRPTAAGTGVLTGLESDFTLMTEWKTRVFDANINRPIVARASSGFGLTALTVHPARARNKLLSHRTNLLDNRPWAIAGPVLTRQLASAR